MKADSLRLVSHRSIRVSRAVVVDEQEAVVGDEAFDPCGGAVRRGSG